MAVPRYTERTFIWSDIAITVRHCKSWLCDDNSVQHIELHSENRAPLPVTETGYRSRFLCGVDALAEFDHDPVAYVTAWLDHAAQSYGWQQHVQSSRQLELF